MSAPFSPPPACTATVTNTFDGGPGSLRAAIVFANSNPGIDTICFNIPAAGVQTIQPTTPLPQINQPIVIDGYTQPGTQVNTISNGDNAILLVELNGSLTVGPGAGIAFNPGANGSVVRGLIINGWRNQAIINSFGAAVSDLTIEGNFIGTNASGTGAVPNGTNGPASIFIGGVGSGNNTIGGTQPAARNLISGNAGTGMLTVIRPSLSALM